ncbi:MAG TPA: hypothetical protein VL460_00690 [Caulobacteraceae bacterium]|jgi:hypothetical protein|nr:hypothetical protein [Caulobacteraceae bacterium]
MPTMTGSLRVLAAGALAVVALWASGAQAEALPAGWQASHMKPLAHLTLPGPRAFKLSIKQHEGRWYLFVAEGGQNPALTLEGRGFNVVDVTDPAKPRLVATVPVQYGGGQLTLHGDLLIAGQQTPFDPGSKHPAEGPFSDSRPAMNDLATFFDISDPVHPKKISTWRTLGWATHRNVYPGGRYAYMSSFVAGYRGQATLTILDVSDPVHPKEVSHWWQPGQRDDEPARPAPNGFHGPVYPSADGRMLTMGYTPGVVNLDVTDPVHPKLIGKLDFAPLPLTGTQSIHTGIPLPNGMVHVSIEPGPPGCTDSAAWAAIVDNKDPARPRLAGYYPRPVPPPGAPYKSFCDKGGRVGPHNVNAEVHLPDAQGPGDLIFMTYFTAGLRVFDISDPYTPRETGWFLPRIGAWETGERGPEDVLVDTRGNIYISEGEAGGLWILRYTNPAGPKLPVTAK